MPYYRCCWLLCWYCCGCVVLLVVVSIASDVRVVVHVVDDICVVVVFAIDVVVGVATSAIVYCVHPFYDCFCCLHFFGLL